MPPSDSESHEDNDLDLGRVGSSLPLYGGGGGGGGGGPYEFSLVGESGDLDFLLLSLLEGGGELSGGGGGDPDDELGVGDE